MRKVKEIKEKEDEKDSLFGKIKSQAAMEYLMTYGWAILIIALVLGVLYSLGIMNPKNFIPRAPPGSCFVFRPNGPGTTDFVSLQGTCGYLPMYVASFNGVNAYIDTPLLQDHVTAYTIAVWAKTSDASGWKAFVQDRGSGAGMSLTLGLHAVNAGDGRVRFVVDSNSILIGVYSNPINDGKWHHIVGTWSAPAGTAVSPSQFNLYIDGVSAIAGTLSGGSATSPLTGLGGTKIARHDAWNSNLNGSIANVQIYNTALTQQEIQYLYQQGLGGGPVRLQNLVAWWPLNGDAKDYSGNNLHGTIYGGVTFVQNYNPP